ncbi:MAG: IPExxxVDY family protein [Cyclobacteriaceae bacterium]
MNKKSVWDEEYPIDFELIGIVSSMKEYKLAWHLNELGIFHLIKADDIKIEFSEKKVVRISNLAEETDFTSVHLLRNKIVGPGPMGMQYLLSDLQRFDYFIKLKNSIEEKWSSKIMAELRKCQAIDYAVAIDVEKVKTKDNLIF